MSTIRAGRGTLYVLSILLVLGATAPSPAQDLLVVRAESLNAVFDGMESISNAVGQDVGRQTVLGMGTEIFGTDPSGFLAFDRPVAALMPVEGMMLQQNGFVLAVPVSDAAAAITALETRLPNHAVEGELHSFSADEGPTLYLTAAEGYVRLGGNADLVKRVDPLANGPTGSALSAEIFLEPVAPMIQASLAMAKQQMMASLEAEARGEGEAPFDPTTMGPMFDVYFDAIRWLVANASSFRVRLDVKDGYVRFAEDLVPKPDGALAGFIAAQTGGLPEIAKLADEGSAWYMAGRLSLTDEHRQGLKSFVDGYIDLVTSVLDSQAAPAENGGSDTASDAAAAGPIAFWDEYMAVMTPYVGRWIDCLRGDMVVSIASSDGPSFRFTEAFGLVDSEACSSLVSEMGDHFADAVEASPELSEAFTLARGPEIGGSESLIMTFDMVKMLHEMGQPSDEQAEAMMTAMYGETMSAAMVAVGDVVLAAGGPQAADHLGELAVELSAPGQAPSFAPLEVRPGMMLGMNLGAMMSWMKDAAPEGADAFQRAAERLSGAAGRVLMSMTFASKTATFDIAVPLETIGVLADIAREQRAKAAEETTPIVAGEETS